MCLGCPILFRYHLFRFVQLRAKRARKVRKNKPTKNFKIQDVFNCNFYWKRNTQDISSLFGSCLISCFTAARIPYVAAREGQFPQLLSMVHIRNATPVPAVLWDGIIATILIFPNDFNSLVNYFRWGNFFTKILIFFTKILIFFTKILIFFTKILIFFTKILIFFTKILIFLPKFWFF